MPSVTIDAGVLAAPPPGSSHEAITYYVETLLDWRKLLDEPWVAIYMSERASDFLQKDGLYPLRESLKQLFSSQGIDQYSVNDVARVADTLLRLTPHFETVFKVKDVLYSDLSTVPDLLSIATTQHMASDLARCVVLFALLREHCQPPVSDHALVVKPWSGGPMINVRALVHDFDHDRNDMQPFPTPPEYFEGTVWVCRSFRELLQGLDEGDIWQSAQDDEGRMIAVDIAIYKSRLARGLEPEWAGGRVYWFGRKFAERADECCGSAATSVVRSLLRAIAETIDRQNLRDVHELRTSDSGGAPQRMRGRDRGWRRDIDREYHLHYWECEDRFEFGWMGPHNDFQLPE